MTQQRTADILMEHHSQTYAAEARITLRDKPSPLYRLLVLSLLFSAPIAADIAVRTSRELSSAGCRTAPRMAEATWQQRVHALGRGGYRRYDERTSTMLGEGAELLTDRYGGDLRRLREEVGKDAAKLHSGLQQFPGIGAVGASIFCREAQGVWPELAPFFDKKAFDGAQRLGLPTSTGQLARLVAPEDLPNLAAGCIRAALDGEVAEDVRRRAR